MILINGCSFCSLPGQWQDYFDLENKNLSIPGNNNETIFHDTVQELSKNKDRYDLCIIVWTFFDRYLISTTDHEEISLYPNLNNNIKLKTTEHEKQLLNYKKILYSYFHSDVLQKKRLENYKKSINAMFGNTVIHLHISELFNKKGISVDSTGHFSKKSSIEIAEEIKKLIKENQHKW